MKRKLPQVVKLIILAVIFASFVMLVNIFGKPYLNNNELSLVTENYTLEPESYVENGEIMVPLRSFADFVGADVKLDSDTMQYQISMGGNSVALKKDETEITFNNEIAYIEVPAVEKGGLIYVPLHIFTEILGAEHEFDEEENTITVKNNGI